jgi:hypothetical protein
LQHLSRQHARVAWLQSSADYKVDVIHAFHSDVSLQ